MSPSIFIEKITLQKSHVKNNAHKFQLSIIYHFLRKIENNFAKKEITRFQIAIKSMSFSKES